MRKIDILQSTLEVIEQLEWELYQAVNEDKSHNEKSLDIKNRIDALRHYVCCEVKASLIKRKVKAA